MQYRPIRPPIKRDTKYSTYQWLKAILTQAKRRGTLAQGMEGYILLDDSRTQFGIKYSGDSIAVRLYETHVAYVSEVEGTTVMRLTGTGWCDRPYTRGFIWDVLGVNIANRKASGVNTMSVAVHQGVEDMWTPLREGMVLKQTHRSHNVLMSTPSTYQGIRTNKAETAELRARFQQVYDLLPVYCAANPDAKFLRKYEGLQHLRNDEIQWEIEHIVQYVCSASRNRKTWNKIEPACPQRARQFLNKLLTITEEYETDKSFA